MIIQAKTFTAWMQANHCKSSLSNIARYGADQGWSGLIYYDDTCKLYAKFKDEIWDMLAIDAEDLGSNPLEFMLSFNRANEIVTHTHFESLLTWYAAERIAQTLVGW